MEWKIRSSLGGRKSCGFGSKAQPLAVALGGSLIPKGTGERRCAPGLATR